MTNSETNPFPEAIHVPKGMKYKWSAHVRKKEIRLGDWAADALDRAVELDSYPDFLRNEIKDAEIEGTDYGDGYVDGMRDALRAFEDGA